MGLFRKDKNINVYDDLFRTKRNVFLDHLKDNKCQFIDFEAEGNELINLLNLTSFEEEKKEIGRKEIKQIILVKKVPYLCQLINNRFSIVVLNPNKEDMVYCYNLYLEVKDIVENNPLYNKDEGKKIISSFDLAFAPYKQFLPKTNDEKNIESAIKEQNDDLDYLEVLIKFDKKLDSLLVNPTIELLNEIITLHNVLTEKSLDLTVNVRNSIVQHNSTILLYLNSMSMQGNNFKMFVSVYITQIKTAISGIKSIIG